jgi:hypothetical protein
VLRGVDQFGVACGGSIPARPARKRSIRPWWNITGNIRVAIETDVPPGRAYLIGAGYPISTAWHRDVVLDKGGVEQSQSRKCGFTSHHAAQLGIDLNAEMRARSGEVAK